MQDTGSWLATVLLGTVSDDPDDFHRWGPTDFRARNLKRQAHVMRIQNFALTRPTVPPGRGYFTPCFSHKNTRKESAHQDFTLAATPKEENLICRRHRRRAFNAKPDLLALPARRGGGRQLSFLCSVPSARSRSRHNIKSAFPGYHLFHFCVRNFTQTITHTAI